jgi:hypothetical protein
LSPFSNFDCAAGGQGYDETGDRRFVGAFGPQLKPFGRQFKLNGYTLDDGQDHLPPLSAMLQTSYTHLDSGGHPRSTATGVGNSACAACHPGAFGGGNVAKDTVAADDVSLFLAGKLTDHIGTFAEVSLNGVSNSIHWDNVDTRYANDAIFFDKDLIYGVTLNNNPSVQDVWNSSPVWSFPFAQSLFAPAPGAATLIDGLLAQTVYGGGVYLQWNDLLYIEADGYHDVGTDARRTLGEPATGQNMLSGWNPYWRVALQHTEGPHDLEIGTYGISANIFPTAVSTFGTDKYTDVAFDASYQYIPSDAFNLGAYATVINERQHLHASNQLVFSNESDELHTWRANVSASFEDTYTPNARYFRTWGSTDPTIVGTPTGNPNSAGWLGEADWVPKGKAGGLSWLLNWLNMRLSVQHVIYTRFDGTQVGASGNDSTYFLAWFAVPLNN